MASNESTRGLYYYKQKHATMMPHFEWNSDRIDHREENIQNKDRKYDNSDKIGSKSRLFALLSSMHIVWQHCAMQQWWGRDVGNAGADKYDFTAKQIQKFQISTFFGKRKITFRKVTPATKLVNEKKFWQA